MTDILEDDDKKPTTLTKDLVQLDQVFEATNLNRSVVIEKLGSVIENMAIDTTDPKVAGAQMSIISTYLNALNGKESNVARRVSSKLKQAEIETTSKHSAAVADLLSRITTSTALKSNGPTMTNEEMSRKVEEAFEKAALEDILDTELKTDPKDLS